MEDIFNEHLIKRKNGFKVFLYKFLIGLAAIVIMAASVYFHLGMFTVVIVLGVGVGLYFAYREFDVEYEYILTNSELDIDKIIARENRKNVLNVNVKDFEILAPYSPEHQQEYSNKTITTVCDYSSGWNDDKRWFAVFPNKSGKTLLIFEPPEKMVNGIRTFIPRSVILPPEK